MPYRREIPFQGGVAHLRFTNRSDGDLSVSSPEEQLAARRAAVTDLPWLALRQVHGAVVVVARSPEDVIALGGSAADASVTDSDGLVLAVHTADCAPVLLVSPEGIIGAAHAGWRGLQAGVLQQTVEAMRRLGATTPTAVLGPCIGTECYEFGSGELQRLAQRYDSTVVARTSHDEPALDLSAMVDAALAEAGLAAAERVGACTACGEEEFFSHRARGDTGRQAAVIWRERA